DALISVLYLSVVTSFICQSIQIFAQKYTKAVIAGLILMLEGFFALVFSILLGYDVLSYDLVVGGIIMMIAFVLAEISLKRKKKNASYQEMIAT
ncbi:MAG: EamA family transporter, partial [Bacilli bacterium]